MTESNALTLLDELDARQDEVLGQLDQLNEQIEDVLEDWTGVPKETEESGVDEEPVDEEPVDGEPVDEEPVDEEPVDEEPVDEEPVDEAA